MSRADFETAGRGAAPAFRPRRAITAADIEENALTRAAGVRRAAGLPLLDLAQTNPTAAGFAWTADALTGALASPANRFYEPDPRGLLAAREAVAAHLAGHGAGVSPEFIHLCSSTSEACGWLLKLLAEPGAEVLVPAPSYPLLQVLADLECVSVRPYPLRFSDGRWRVDAAALEAAVTPAARAIFCVAPNNPTGSVLDDADRAVLRVAALRHRLPLVVDEVFLDFGAAGGALRSWADEREAPLFALGGLSKTALLPQMKLAWCVTAGPPRWRRGTVARLDHIADAYLSASTPVQNAAGAFLAAAGGVRAPLVERVRRNDAALGAWCAAAPHRPRLLPREAGWMAMLELPRGVDEERAALALVRDTGVLLHPGYFYDTPPAPPFWVVSQITPPATLDAALPALDEMLLRF